MATRPPGVTLSVERRLAAGRDRVFDALTVPEQIRGWWGPRGFDSRVLELDLRRDGRYRIAMAPPQGEMFHVTGTFRVVAPPGRLEYTFRWEEPDPDDRETIVAVSLERRGTTTALTVTQGPFATAARRGLHRNGWSESLDRLGEMLAATP